MADLKDLIADGIMKYDGYEGTEFVNERCTLTVVGWNGLRGNPGKYIVRCSVCSSDSELNGEGYFAMAKGHLTKGGIPCGCTNKANWTEDQYKVRLRRMCELKGVIFRGWEGEYLKSNSTKVLLECPEHGLYVSPNISYTLNPKHEKGCAGCFAIRMGNYKRKDDQEMVDKFMASGGFADGTIFRRSEREDKHGHKKYWFVYCPECDSEGEAHMVGFYKGARCCACVVSRPLETYINLINDGDTTVAIKFGVANLAHERIKSQNLKSVYDVVNYGIWKYPNTKSCRSAERECMKSLTTGVVNKRDFSDGFTETTYPTNIDAVISIFEKNGGVRVV